MNVYIPLPEFVAQWFVHEQGGSVPVRLMRGSVEAQFLESFLQRLPPGETPRLQREGEVAVELPQFRSRDTRTYNHLPEQCARALAGLIRNRFDVDMWGCLHKFSNLGMRRDELIYAFMEARGIEPTEKNWNAIAKRYKRKCDTYRAARRRKKLTDPEE